MGFFSDLGNVAADVSGYNTISRGWDSFTGKPQQQAANEANVASAREQMAFQERMSSTAHQREVKDLEAAGINPILSAKLGGASSPGGAMAVQSPMPSSTGKFISTAMDMKRFADDRRAANQGIVESQSRADLNSAQALNAASNTDKTKAGWTGGVIGTDISNFIRKVLKRGYSSAKESFRKFEASPKSKQYEKGPGDKALDWYREKRKKNRQDFNFQKFNPF